MLDGVLCLILVSLYTEEGPVKSERMLIFGKNLESAWLTS